MERIILGEIMNKIYIYLFIAILFGGVSYAVCVTPAPTNTTYYINTPGQVDICAGNYNFSNYTGGMGAIRINVSNVLLNLSGVSLYGNISTGTYGITIADYIQNTTINDGYIKWFRYGFIAFYVNGTVFNRTEFDTNYNSGIDFAGANNTIVDNVSCHGSINSHGIYFDAQNRSNEGNKIINSRFYNNAGAGIQLNDAASDAFARNKWMIVSNNKVYDNTQAGIQDLGNYYINITGNNITNNSLRGITSNCDGADTNHNHCTVGTLITNNTFFNNVPADITVEYGAANITIQGNTYLTTNPVININNGYAVSCSINETTTQALVINVTNVTALITFNYSGYKVLNNSNNSYTITGYFPYNDVYNVSTKSVLSSNVDNYTITLVANQQIIIGDFTPADVGGNDPSSCASPAAKMILGFTELPNWFSIILMLVAVGVIIGIVFYAMKSDGEPDFEPLLYAIWPITIGGIILAIAILILESMC